MNNSWISDTPCGVECVACQSRQRYLSILSSALGLILLLAAAGAVAAGGDGGGPDGGAGGTLGKPAGGDAAPGSNSGGGGGGPGGGSGGLGDGNGGDGGDGGAPGYEGAPSKLQSQFGPNNQLIGEDGGDGESVSPLDAGDGGGGGAGGYGALLTGPGTAQVRDIQAITGGGGGDGGAGDSGGDGGDGGIGVRLEGDGTVVNAGTISGGNGGNGGRGSDSGGGGIVGLGGDGGSGGIGIRLTEGGTVDNVGTISGGDGGNGGGGGDGGLSDPGGPGGDGGDGGIGVRLTGGGKVHNAGTISGGDGGDGGDGGPGDPGGNGGDGGDGGTGVRLMGGGKVHNEGTISGGDGGPGGAGGAGGIGVIGADLTVINSGTIEAGLSGDGSTHANAIEFIGGTNRLELRAGSVINGVVDATADTSSTFVLGGASNASLDVSAIGASAQYRGFEAFEKTGTSTWTLTGTTAAETQWTLTAGTLSVSSDSNLGAASGSLILDGGTLRNTAAFSTARNITLGAGGGTFQTDADLTASGIISGTGALIKTGTGTLKLTGANTYTGGTTIKAGTLVGDSASLSGDLTFAGSSGNTPQVIFDQTTDSSYTGDISGNGILTKTGTGTLTLTGTTTQDWTLKAGTLEAGSSSALGDGAAYAINGGTLDLNNFDLIMGKLSGSDGQIALGGAALTIDQAANTTYAGVISGNGTLAKTGTGTLTLTGTTTQDWTLKAGTLEAGSSSALSDGAAYAINGGTLDLAGFDLTMGKLSGSSGQVMLNGAALTIDQAANTTYAGVISGNGTLAKTGGGTLTLKGTNTYNGNTTIKAGTLQIGNGGTTGTLGTGGVDIKNGATLTFYRKDGITYTGSIAGKGKLIQKGAGTLTLNGDSSVFSGTTAVRSGILIVGGTASSGAVLGGNVSVASGAVLGGHGMIGGDVTVAAESIVTPGNYIGTLTISGDYTAQQYSLLSFEFGAPASDPFTQFGKGDSLIVGGDLTLNGAVLDVSDTGSMGPGLYNIFTWDGTLTKTNGGLSFGSTPTGAKLQLQTLTSAGQINLLNTTGETLNVWNANEKASKHRMGGGDGVWSTTSSNWTNATGSVPNSPMQPQPGFALFGGDSGMVTIENTGGTVSATGMQFAVDGYILKGDDLKLVANGDDAPVIRVGDGSSDSAAMTAIIKNTLTGNDGLTKADYGTLVLAGRNTYTGGTTVTGGTLEIASGGKVGAGTVTVDDSAGQDATLKVDTGVTLSNEIVLNNGGTLNNAGTIDRRSNQFGVESDNGTAIVYNHNQGRIIGEYSGVSLQHGGMVVNNNSTIRAVGANGAGVYVSGPMAKVVNKGAGIIKGQDAGVSLLSDGGKVVNAGSSTIRATRADGTGVYGYDSTRIVNKGASTIEGGKTGVVLRSGGSVTNTAGSTISGGTYSIYSRHAAATVRNAGTLKGDVKLGDFANKVKLSAGSTLQGNLDIGTNADSTLTLAGNNATPQGYTDAVTGTTTFAGRLIKSGSGSWIIDTNDLSGVTNTTIKAGRLAINGALPNATTTVTGGILAGTGTVDSTTIQSGGTLAPGNSIGTMTINGDVTFNGGTYAVEVDPDGHSDRTEATGQAKLNGGTVAVHPLGPKAAYGDSTDYTILTADGGVNGKFANVNSALAFLTPTLGYGPNAVTLTLERNNTDFDAAAHTPNQHAVASALTTAETQGELPDIIHDITGRSAAGARSAYDNLSGVQHTHAQLLALHQQRLFRNALFDRLGAAPASLPRGGQSVWGRVMGSTGTIDATDNATGADYTTGGLAVGVDQRLAHGVTVGVAAGYTHTEADTAAHGNLDLDSFHLAGYAGWQGKPLYVRASLGVVRHRIDAERRVTVGGSPRTARADYDATQVAAAIETGHIWHWTETTSVTPFVGLAWNWLRREDFTESGAGRADLAVADETTTSLRSRLGLRLTGAWSVAGAPLHPRFALAWVHEYSDRTAALTAHFASAPGTTFTVEGPELDRDRLAVDAGITAELTETMSLDLAYSGRFAGSDQHNSLSLTWRMQW